LGRKKNKEEKREVGKLFTAAVVFCTHQLMNLNEKKEKERDHKKERKFQIQSPGKSNSFVFQDSWKLGIEHLRWTIGTIPCWSVLKTRTIGHFGEKHIPKDCCHIGNQ
jgi:predicted nucleotidyltransferase component of viral defense system